MPQHICSTFSNRYFCSRVAGFIANASPTENWFRKWRRCDESSVFRPGLECRFAIWLTQRKRSSSWRTWRPKAIPWLKIVVLSYVQRTFSFFLFYVVQMIEYIPKQLCTWRNLISISMVFEAITVPNVFLKKVGQSRPFFIYFGPF